MLHFHSLAFGIRIVILLESDIMSVVAYKVMERIDRINDENR